MTDHDGPDEIDSGTPPVPPPPPADTPPPKVSLGADGTVSVQDGASGGVAGSAPAGGPPPPAPSLLQRIPKRLLIGGGILLVVLAIGWFAGRGKTDAVDLQAGDCFEAPTSNDIRDVKDQSCNGLHDVEILAVTSLPAGTEWPGANPFALGDTAASEACFNAIDPNRINFANVPDDALEGQYFPDQDAWNDGDRKILCYAQSATGFPGPVMNRE